MGLHTPRIALHPSRGLHTHPLSLFSKAEDCIHTPNCFPARPRIAYAQSRKSYVASTFGGHMSLWHCLMQHLVAQIALVLKPHVKHRRCTRCAQRCRSNTALTISRVRVFAFHTYGFACNVNFHQMLFFFMHWIPTELVFCFLHRTPDLWMILFALFISSRF